MKIQSDSRRIQVKNMRSSRSLLFSSLLFFSLFFSACDSPQITNWDKLYSKAQRIEKASASFDGGPPSPIKDAHKMRWYRSALTSDLGTYVEYSSFTKVEIDPKDWPLWKKKLTPTHFPGYYAEPLRESVEWWMPKNEFINDDYFVQSFYLGNKEEYILKGFIAVSSDRKSIYSFSCGGSVCPIRSSETNGYYWLRFQQHPDELIRLCEKTGNIGDEDITNSDGMDQKEESCSLAIYFLEAMRRNNQVVNFDYNERLSQFYLDRGKIKYHSWQAMDDFNEALKLNPKNIGGLIARGELKAFFDDNQGALVDLDRALELDSENVEANEARKNLKIKMSHGPL